ncbi:MAG: flagellar brake protein [Desulfobacteraceae bacterium]|nr:flagellar brake protein [Desulfobacteraceae bacterium]
MEEIEGMLELSDVEGIYIDIGTQVYIEIDGVDFSVTSIFIGLLKNEFLIVTLPRRYRSVKTKLYPGSKMVVRYLYDGCVFAFQTTVIEILTNPIRTLALEYPKIVQQRELRIVKRNNVVIPGRVEARKTEFPIVIFDISKKGCRFTYHDTNNITTLKEGDIIRVYCRLPGVSDEIGAMAIVRNVKREQKQISVGTKFQDITKAFLTPLMHFLFAIEGYKR